MNISRLFDNYEVFRCPSWLFEQPRELEKWIYFHLSALEGSRSKELALLARYASTVFCALYRANGPLYVSKYLKVSSVMTRRYLAARSPAFPHRSEIPVGYTSSDKMVRVSLSRIGLPRWFLLRHRNMMKVGHPEEHKWVRIYLTLCGLYKLIIIPQPINVASVLDDRVYRPSLPPSKGPLVNPILALYAANPRAVYVPLELGYSTKLMWTAGPLSEPGLGVLSCSHLKAQALLLLLTPMELRFWDHLFSPSQHYLPGVAGSRYPRFNLKYPTFVSYLIRRTVATCNPPIDTSRTWSIGRVGVKDEPAGK